MNTVQYSLCMASKLKLKLKVNVVVYAVHAYSIEKSYNLRKADMAMQSFML